MLVKFFKHGQGDGKAAVEYLLKDSEHEPKRVIRGNSALTLSIIENIPYKNRYKSGVLSFEEADIDPDTKETIMDLFEWSIFAGIDDEDRNILWVEHKEKGRQELHFLIPRIHLGTGKAFNPYYQKADLERIDTFKNLVNLKYSLSDPNDPMKSRTHSYDYNPHEGALIDIPKDELAEALYALVADGVIGNREDLIDTLKSAGYEVPRTGKNYISVKAEDMKKAKRFKGGIFNESFTSVEELEREEGAKLENYRRDRNHREAGVEQLSQKLERLNRQKALYHQTRYPKQPMPSAKDAADRDRDRSRDDIAFPLRRSRIDKQESPISNIPTGAVDEQEKQHTDSVADESTRKRMRRERSVSTETRQDRTSRFERFRATRSSLYEQAVRDKRERRAHILERTGRGLNQASRELKQTGEVLDEAARILGNIIEKRRKPKRSMQIGGLG